MDHPHTSPYAWCPPALCTPILKKKKKTLISQTLDFHPYQESPFPGLKEKESFPSILNRFKGINQYILPVVSIKVKEFTHFLEPFVPGFKRKRFQSSFTYPTTASA